MLSRSIKRGCPSRDWRLPLRGCGGRGREVPLIWEFLEAQTSSRSAPRLFRKKYDDAPITIAKNATTAASIANAPKSTRAPGTSANWCDQIAAYPSELCAASLPAGVVVHGAEQHRIANPIAKAISVTLRSVFIGTQSTPDVPLQDKHTFLDEIGLGRRSLHRIGRVGADDSDAMIEKGCVDARYIDLRHVAGYAILGRYGAPLAREIARCGMCNPRV